MKVRVFGDVLVEKLADQMAGHNVRRNRADAPASLNSGNDNRFVFHCVVTASARQAVPFTAPLAADVCLVSLNGSLKQVRRENVLKGKPNAVAHEPRGAVRADLQLPLKL